MSCITITKVIEIVFELSDIDGYGFGKDKKLYNLKTGRIIRQTINVRSKGYWIGKRFYSLNKLRPLLIRPKNYNCPF